MISTISYRIITGIVALCNWLGLFHWRVTGIENLPARSSGMILVCNHLEWHDIPLIGWGLPIAYQPWWFAKHDLLHGWWYGWWVKRMPIIPVKRGQRDRDAVQHAIGAVKNGAVLVVFPEGTWDYSGKLLPAKSGASRIALATGAPIVPLAIVGNHISPWGKSRQLIIGEPFWASSLALDSPPSASDIAQLTTTIMVRIAQLLPPEYHGYYAPLMATPQSPSKEH
jgi:1-acyl-sn-glycerol-3-phosphate acyltransferase